jgi:thiamine-phosphate pyrophosphorylase
MSEGGGAVERAAPRLLVPTDRSVASATETLRRFEHVARAATPFSVMFQLRDRELAAAERLAFGRELRALCTAEAQWFQLNDRCDLAVLLDADGVHLAEASIAAADARRIVGPGSFISRACHEQEGALEKDVDAWVLSPIFAQRKGRGALGIEALVKLRERCRASARAEGVEPRVFALGGVSARTAASCLAAGAAGVVAIGAVFGGDVDALLAALGISRRGPLESTAKRPA